MSSSRAHILIGIAIGLTLSLGLAYISFLYAIHDGFRVAAYFFPHAVLLSPDIDSVSLVSLLVAFILWPLYGAILGSSLARGRRRLQLVLVCLLIQHVALGSLAWSRVDSRPVTINENYNTLKNTSQAQRPAC
jgi:hypothetical protein